MKNGWDLVFISVTNGCSQVEAFVELRKENVLCGIFQWIWKCPTFTFHSRCTISENFWVILRKPGHMIPLLLEPLLSLGDTYKIYIYIKYTKHIYAKISAETKEGA